nr:response regulator transcription factor [Rhodococcus sp. (in: high G+C Gram-positive bacteria)]
MNGIDTDREYSQHLLLADEKPDDAARLIESLERLGHHVTHVNSGIGLIGALQDEPTADKIVVSATLPDIGPEAMCRRLRTSPLRRIVIVVLPVRDELETVLSLDAGADDCVERPYRPRELAARIRAIARREPEPKAPGPDDENCFDCGDIVVDVARREVRVGELTVELTRKEFDLLALLVQNRSFVVSRDIIAECVWNGTWSTRTIDTHVASLRSKLDRPELIRTVRGVGFKLTA